jgi:hypothetical protein
MQWWVRTMEQNYCRHNKNKGQKKSSPRSAIKGPLFEPQTLLGIGDLLEAQQSFCGSRPTSKSSSEMLVIDVRMVFYFLRESLHQRPASCRRSLETSTAKWYDESLPLCLWDRKLSRVFLTCDYSFCSPTVFLRQEHSIVTCSWHTRSAHWPLSAAYTL